MFKVLELVKDMWTFYKDRIIQNYCALFPDIEKKCRPWLSTWQTHDSLPKEL